MAKSGHGQSAPGPGDPPSTVEHQVPEDSSAPARHTTLPDEKATVALTTPGGGTGSGSGVTDSFPRPFGRYRILKRLGQGGMGSVYLAEDAQLSRKIALKVPRFAEGELRNEILQRFEREARAAAAIHHPNICPIFDVGEVDGVHYLTFAYVEGESLSDLIRRSGALPIADSVRWLRIIAAATDEAHRCGIVHRDLKPSNVMINRRGEPVILDFGLAQRTGQVDIRLTPSGMMVGTPAYMPPEQAAGRLSEMGPWSDIYSLGAILYECLTGKLPFRGDLMSILSQIANHEPDPVSRLRVEVDAYLEAICAKAMAKRIEERFQSAAELVAELDAWLASIPEPAPTKPISSLFPGRANQFETAKVKVAKEPGKTPAKIAVASSDSGAARPGPRRWLRSLAVSVGALLVALLAVSLLRRGAFGELVSEAFWFPIIATLITIIPLAVSVWIVRRIF